MEKTTIPSLNEKIIKDSKDARNPWDSMWQTDWENIFNQQVNNAVFHGNYEIDDVDINAREILKKIKEIQPRMTIGSDYEIKFLAYCGALDMLLMEDRNKRKFAWEHKNHVYANCLGKLMREWAYVRQNYMIEQIRYYLDFGYPNSELVEYVNLIEKQYILGKNIQSSSQEKSYFTYLYLNKGKVEIPLEQYSKLQEVIKTIELFSNKAIELINRTTIKPNDYSGYPEGILLTYKSFFEQDEAVIMSILKNCFIPKVKFFSNKINELKSIKNEILLRLGLSVDALPDKSQEGKQHQKIKGYIPKMEDKITMDSLLKRR